MSMAIAAVRAAAVTIINGPPKVNTFKPSEPINTPPAVTAMPAINKPVPESFCTNDLPNPRLSNTKSFITTNESPILYSLGLMITILPLYRSSLRVLTTAFSPS